ncbi:MAG: pentapeptide repeat-containing protein [Symploca sp. SIO2G7]|nr:pentapeptide repeat-containing protein [Symploca sp. SIO2G7]
MAHEFHHANLWGANFRGKNLAGADFSHANIRGVDFSNALLMGTDFSYAKAGLPISKTICLIALSIILSLFAGSISAYAGAIVGDLLSNGIYGHSFFGFVALITLVIFLIIIIWQGLGVILAMVAEAVAACLITAIVFFPENQAGYNLSVGSILTAITLVGTMAGVGHIAVAVAIERVLALPGARALTIFIAFMGAILGTLFGVKAEKSTPVEAVVVAYLITGLVALIAIALGIYIGWQAIAGNPKYWLIRSLAVGIVAKGGTNFRGADLTNADFSHTTLTSLDFRQANLTRTCWFRVQKLSQARVEGTYLADSKVQELVLIKMVESKTLITSICGV